MTNGATVAAFERAFAEYVGARYAIALCNGTATLHTALIALGVKPGDRVAVPPLTMSATTIAVLHAGAVPSFWDVHPHTWLMDKPVGAAQTVRVSATVPVSLYGLNQGTDRNLWSVDDAAQTLRPHSGCAFTSYSFQASKILTLGEGGMLCTNSEELATKAREFSSLGYRMRADQPRIDPAVLKSPTYERHHSLGWNYRMNDYTAWHGLQILKAAPHLLSDRQRCAAMYRDAIGGCSWLTPQHVPDGWRHDWWTYAVAIGDDFVRWRQMAVARWDRLADAIGRHGGERPYAAWCLTYQEPAFRHLAPSRQEWFPRQDGGVDVRESACPVAEDLQPRLMQFQTNNLASAEKNAAALSNAIRELGG